MPGLSPELAHSYGLFCHVGLPVLMQSVRGYAGTMMEGRVRRDRSFVETENANHRTDHAVVGALTARAWRLAPVVMAAIRLHHSLESLGSADTEPEVHPWWPPACWPTTCSRAATATPEPEWGRFGHAACEWLAISADDLGHWRNRSANRVLSNRLNPAAISRVRRQRANLPRHRDVARLELARDALAVGGRAVLADLPLADQRGYGDLDGDDRAEHLSRCSRPARRPRPRGAARPASWCR